MTSRREKLAQQKKAERTMSKNGVPGMLKSCQSKHPLTKAKCFMGKDRHEGRCVAMVAKPGGGYEKLYWTRLD